MSESDSPASVIELPTETENVYEKKVKITTEVVVEKPLILKNGVYRLDFTKPPSVSSNWKIHEHKGKVLHYNPAKTVLFSLGDLGLKDGATIADCIKKLKKAKQSSMVANFTDFISEEKPELPNGFSSAYVYFLDTIFKTTELFVCCMYFVDIKNAWVIKHDPITKKLGPYSRIACY